MPVHQWQGLSRALSWAPSSDPQFLEFCQLHCGIRFVLFPCKLLLLITYFSLRYTVFKSLLIVVFITTQWTKGFFSSIKCFEKLLFKTEWNLGSAGFGSLPPISLNSDPHSDDGLKNSLRNKYMHNRHGNLSDLSGTWCHISEIFLPRLSGAVYEGFLVIKYICVTKCSYFDQALNMLWWRADQMALYLHFFQSLTFWSVAPEHAKYQCYAPTVCISRDVFQAYSETKELFEF